MQPTVVVADRVGQLGNQLILFSHLIALAEECQIRVVNPAFVEYSHAFKGTRSSFYSSFPPSRRVRPARQLREFIFRGTNLYARGVRRGYWGGRDTAFIGTDGDTPEFDKDLSQSPYLNTIRSSRTTYLFGWRYRNYELFLKHSDLIRDFFKPVAHLERIKQFMSDLREKYEVLIALHIRQGDYETFMNGRYFLTTPSYRNIVEGVVGQLSGKRVGIIVFSNVKQDLSIFHPLNVIPAPGDTITDLYSMALADYIIAAPSTFSRWAAFYGKVPLGYVTAESVHLSLLEFSIAQY